MSPVAAGSYWQLLLASVLSKLAWPAALFTSRERETAASHETQELVCTCLPPISRLPMAMSGRRFELLNDGVLAPGELEGGCKTFAPELSVNEYTQRSP